MKLKIENGKLVNLFPVSTCDLETHNVSVIGIPKGYFFYRANNGNAHLQKLNEEGKLEGIIKKYSSLPTESHVVPINFPNNIAGILFYQSNKGECTFYQFNKQNGLDNIKQHSNWRKTWTKIIFFTFNNEPTLLFYDESANHIEFYTIETSGELSHKKTWDNINSWQHIVPIKHNDEMLLLFYRMGEQVNFSGYAEFYKYPELELVKNYSDWYSKWSHILPLNTSQLSKTQILFYDKEYSSQILQLNIGCNAEPRKTYEINFEKQYDLPKGWGSIATTYFSSAGIISFLGFGNGSNPGLFNYWPLSWPIRPIEGYASLSSVEQNETISFHVSSQIGGYQYQIYRIGKEDQPRPITSPTSKEGKSYEIPCNAYEAGCNWEVGFSWKPESQKSGLYLTRLSGNNNYENTGEPYSIDIPFVVKASTASENRILVCLAHSTYQAYNCWGGKNIYGVRLAHGFTWQQDKAKKVSFNRPFLSPYPLFQDREEDGKVNKKADKELQRWEVPFIKWLEEKGYNADYCTTLDLHNSEIPAKYKLIVSIGHDEYWSKQMLNHATSFVKQGGNIAFFSGNVCWWEVNFDIPKRIMECNQASKEAQTWQSEKGFHPLIGVSFRHGICMNIGDKSPYREQKYGFKVLNRDHAIFKRTELENDSFFGVCTKKEIDYSSPTFNIVGYETDAVALQLTNNNQYILDKTFYPEEENPDERFLVLAVADLKKNRQSKEKISEKLATMGIFKIDKEAQGSVFTAATTDWSFGLEQEKVSQITDNVIKQFTQ